MQPIGREIPRPVTWQQALLVSESDFIIAPIPDLRRLGGPMQVELIAGSGIYQKKCKVLPALGKWRSQPSPRGSQTLATADHATCLQGK
ncbi:hypothetical protein [Mongoliitalea daihaiensis]|uniref:hypothetical protein n=1 Tax=Mongoliitalea daihaiensis TaxID=2782006 RepID=UPI001F1CD52E|nr:hypothetical protein [Mongoliitalea daihaiensis]UJP65864.1 hypothetical protein IPZ59_04365 [Mongoliitalea daihaiensis]